MKKLILALLVLCVTIATLAACADTTSGTETGTESAAESASESVTTGGTESETTPSESTSESVSETPTVEVDPTKAVEYTITVKTQGGMAVSGVTVSLTDESGTLFTTGTTDKNGSFSTKLEPAAYIVTLSDLKPGYTATQTQTAATGGETTVTVTTGVITTEDPRTAYSVGDVMYDFTFLKDGQEVKLSELLETKKLVVINFWATWCSPCKSEFPAIEEAYTEYSDSVEIVAFSTSDSASACDEFKTNNGYTFTMTPDMGLYSRFASVHGGASIPCTIFVDRYGVIVYGMVGGNASAAAWKAEFEKLVSDDYVQGNVGDDSDETQTETEREKPDVSMPAAEDIAAVANGEGFNATYTADDGEYIWPWVLTEDKTAIQPSNYGKHDSTAMLHAEMTLEKGQIFAFDFEYSIEYDTYGTQIYDMFAVYVDGHIMQKHVVPQDGWATCYVYTPLESGTYTITLAYVKDSGDSYAYMTPGQEYVHVKNLRLTTEADLTAAGGSMNVYRPAAWGESDSAATSYKNYASDRVVFNKQDGYYHIDDENGPLLLAKLCGSTQWSATSLQDLAYAGYLKIDGIDYSAAINEGLSRSYCWLESYSTLGYSIVDQKLASLLDLFASEVGDGPNHDWEWLEFCCWFDHYGVGEGVTKVTDIRQGLDMASALPSTLGKNHVDINQVVVPRGFYFAFVPEKTGVYTFYSIDEGATVSDAAGTIDTIAWLLDATDTVIDWGDNERDSHFQIWHTLEAGKTYYITVGFDPVDNLGSFDFMIEYVGDKLDVLTVCTGAWTTNDDASEIIIWRNYDFEAALGTDGYYHQVLGYEADGTPILDYSETGYVYVDFLGKNKNVEPEGAAYIPWIGDWATLQKCIEQGYYTDDGELHPDAFDFTQRVDGSGESLADLGNHQAEMEAYLAEALAGDPESETYGFVKADEKLAHILSDLMKLYGMRNYDGNPVADEWLMFCCFMRHV